MDSINQSRESYDVLAKRLARTEAKLGATNFMLCVLMLGMLCLVGMQGYQMYQKQSQAAVQQEHKARQLAVLKKISSNIGEQLMFIETSYPDTVYKDPGGSGVMHQMFRVMEYQLEVLKMLVLQNQVLLSSQVDDSTILTNTFESFTGDTAIGSGQAATDPAEQYPTEGE